MNKFFAKLKDRLKTKIINLFQKLERKSSKNYQKWRRIIQSYPIYQTLRSKQYAGQRQIGNKLYIFFAQLEKILIKFIFRPIRKLFTDDIIDFLNQCFSQVEGFVNFCFQLYDELYALSREKMGIYIGRSLRFGKQLTTKKQYVKLANNRYARRLFFIIIVDLDAVMFFFLNISCFYIAYYQQESQFYIIFHTLEILFYVFWIFFPFTCQFVQRQFSDRQIDLEFYNLREFVKYEYHDFTGKQFADEDEQDDEDYKQWGQSKNPNPKKKKK